MEIACSYCNNCPSVCSEVLTPGQSNLSMMNDASPEVLESMEDAPNIHEEEVLTG